MNNTAVFGSLGFLYRVHERIGSGSFGEVFRGTDQTGKPVALKVLDVPASDKDLLDDLKREISIGLGCENPHVVRAIDYSLLPNQKIAVVMELATCSLRDKLSRGPLRLFELSNLAMDVTDGLAYLNEQGYIHNDVRPNNLLLFGPSIWKIADFGVAIRACSAPRRCYTTYRPPELFLQPECDWRVDQYQLGLTLYHAMTGFAPLPCAISDESCREQILSARPRLAAEGLQLNGGYEGRFAAIVARMLRRRREYRYESWRELQQEVCQLAIRNIDVAAVLRSAMSPALS